MFSSFFEKLLLKMGNTFHEILKKPSHVQRWVGMGLVKSVLARTGWVGGLVKNVMFLSVNTLRMIPLPEIQQ